MERRPAAILAADRIGYSEFAAAEKVERFEQQRAHRAALIGPKITRYGTRVVKFGRPRSGTFATRPLRKCGTGEGQP